EGSRFVAGGHQVTVFVMNVLPIAAVAGMAVVIKQSLQPIDMIGGQGKVVTFTKLPLGGKSGHLFPGIPMKAITTDHGGINALTGKHAAEDLPGCGGTCPGRSGNGNNRMASGHKSFRFPDVRQTRLVSSRGFSTTNP